MKSENSNGAVQVDLVNNRHDAIHSRFHSSFFVVQWASHDFTADIVACRLFPNCLVREKATSSSPSLYALSTLPWNDLKNFKKFSYFFSNQKLNCATWCKPKIFTMEVNFEPFLCRTIGSWSSVNFLFRSSATTNNNRCYIIEKISGGTELISRWPPSL